MQPALHPDLRPARISAFVAIAVAIVLAIGARGTPPGERWRVHDLHLPGR